jgi:dihydrofolate synthase/folylpolyglutamate synthase
MQDLDSWLEHIAAAHTQTIDMGLQRMQDMVGRLELHKPAPTIITVAGTNGKGSTCYATEAFLLAAGLTVGATLSPHVSRFNERVRINGQEADDDLLCQAFAAIEDARDGLPLTYFEFSALAALWCFVQAQVEVCILEIGLGGRLDAFNAVDADIAVITSIGLDHQQYLGNTRQAIGAEKAGILRAGQSVFLGPDMPASVMEACNLASLKPTILGERWRVANDAEHHCWGVYEADQCRLANQAYQQCAPQNLLLAYLTANAVKPMSVDCIADINQRLKIPGRMQQFDFKQRLVVCDVAHNPAAAEFLGREIAFRGWQPTLIVCGMLQDKDHSGVFKALVSHLNAPWLLLSTGSERGLTAADLRAQLPDDANVAPISWSNLLHEVDTATRSGDVILVFGSFDLVARVSELMDNNVA